MVHHDPTVGDVCDVIVPLRNVMTSSVQRTVVSIEWQRKLATDSRGTPKQPKEDDGGVISSYQTDPIVKPSPCSQYRSSTRMLLEPDLIVMPV